MSKTLADHLAKVLRGLYSGGRCWTEPSLAKAILNDPVIATIIGKAAKIDIGANDDVWCEASALLDEFVAERLEAHRG